MSQKTAIQKFVRNVLGCTCPDEVFEQIDIGPVTSGDYRWLRLLIGERLLIYIARMDNQEQINTELPVLLQSGREERDHRGYNRFRAVLATTDRLRFEPAAHRVFQRWEDRDPDTFLHLVDRQHIVSFAND